MLGIAQSRDGSRERGQAGPRRGQGAHAGLFPKGSGEGWVSSLRSAWLREKKKKARSWLQKRVLFEIKHVFSFFFFKPASPFSCGVQGSPSLYLPL